MSAGSESDCQNPRPVSFSSENGLYHTVNEPLWHGRTRSNCATKCSTAEIERASALARALDLHLPRRWTGASGGAVAIRARL